ncbi:MAG: DUF2157 domain-containing protein [Nevskiales bacterium]
MRWLLQELPALVEQGVLDERQAKQLHDHYLPHLDGASLGRRFLVVLGALLMGLGVILLIAHNWPSWTREMRTVICFMPLVLGQLLAGWTLLRQPNSVSWREGSASFLFLAIGACIALIEQTWHLGTQNYAGFLMTWALLGLPLVYLLRASTPLLLYWGGIVGMAATMQQQWGHALLFWLFWLAGLPHVVLHLREAPWSWRSLMLSWAACLSLLLGVATALERSVPGLWLMLYAGLFAGIYLTHYRWLRKAPDVLRSPFQIIGAGGVIALSMLLTFDGPWQRVGGDYLRSSWQYREFAGLFDYVVLAAVLFWWLSLIRRVLRRRDVLQFVYAGLPLLVVGLYGVAAWQGPVWAILAAMNVYLLLLGLMTLREGMQGQHPVALNVGLLVLCSLLMLRFFDSQLSFTVRGIAFVLIGAGFLAANGYLRRHMERQDA